MTKKLIDQDAIIELRITLKTMFTNVSTVVTALEEEAFKEDLKIESRKIGGVFEQTWGFVVSGTAWKVDRFKTWYEDHQNSLCDNTIFNRGGENVTK